MRILPVFFAALALVAKPLAAQTPPGAISPTPKDRSLHVSQLPDQLRYSLTGSSETRDGYPNQ